MLLSDVISQYRTLTGTLFHPQETTVIVPSKLVLFLCDLISIIKKAHKEYSEEQVTNTLSQMFSQREADTIPGLV